MARRHRRKTLKHATGRMQRVTGWQVLLTCIIAAVPPLITALYICRVVLRGGYVRVPVELILIEVALLGTAAVMVLLWWQARRR